MKKLLIVAMIFGMVSCSEPASSSKVNDSSNNVVNTTSSISLREQESSSISVENISSSISVENTSSSQDSKDTNADSKNSVQSGNIVLPPI